MKLNVVIKVSSLQQEGDTYKEKVDLRFCPISLVFSFLHLILIVMSSQSINTFSSKVPQYLS